MSFRIPVSIKPTDPPEVRRAKRLAYSRIYKEKLRREKGVAVRPKLSAEEKRLRKCEQSKLKYVFDQAGTIPLLRKFMEGPRP